MRKVSNREALKILITGGECRSTVLTYFVREGVLFYRDPKGVEHRSYSSPERILDIEHDWTVVKEATSWLRACDATMQPSLSEPRSAASRGASCS